MKYTIIFLQILPLLPYDIISAIVWPVGREDLKLKNNSFISFFDIGGSSLFATT